MARIIFTRFLLAYRIQLDIYIYIYNIPTQGARANIGNCGWVTKGEADHSSSWQGRQLTNSPSYQYDFASLLYQFFSFFCYQQLMSGWCFLELFVGFHMGALCKAGTCSVPGLRSLWPQAFQRFETWSVQTAHHTRRTAFGLRPSPFPGRRSHAFSTPFTGSGHVSRTCAVGTATGPRPEVCPISLMGHCRRASDPRGRRAIRDRDDLGDAQLGVGVTCSGLMSLMFIFWFHVPDVYFAV